MVFLLAFFGMICWGIAPIFAKIGLSKVDPLVGLAMRTYLSAALLTIWLLPKGTLTLIKTIPLKSVIFLGIEGLFATLLGDLAYYAALKYGEVSFVTLVMSCSPIISILTAVIFLKEQISLIRLIGTAFIIFGLFLVMK